MSGPVLLGDAARSGVFRLPTDAGWIHRAAAERGFVCWRVDLSAARDKTALLASLARALEFPGWFGGNWDALQDCLADLSWRSASGYVVVLEHGEGIATHAPGDFGTALEVFREAADFWRGQGVPFWVFVGGVGGGRDLPRLNQGT